MPSGKRRVHSVNGCHNDLTVVIMTTADKMQPMVSGRHPKLFLISDLYRVDTETAEVNADIAQSILKSLLL